MHHPFVPLLIVLLAQSAPMVAVMLQEPPLPWLLAGLPLAAMLGLREAISDREARRERLRGLERELADDPAEGEIILPGKLIFLRPQGDESDYTIETQTPSGLNLTTTMHGPQNELHWSVRERIAHGETSSPDALHVPVALDTDRGRVTLEGPVHVVLGDPDGNWDINAPRRLGEHARVKARGRLVEESMPSGEGSSFRKALLWLRLEPTAHRPGGAAVIPLLSVEPPGMRWDRVWMFLLLWLIASAVGLIFSRFIEHKSMVQLEPSAAQQEAEQARSEAERARDEAEQARRELEQEEQKRRRGELDLVESQRREREKTQKKLEKMERMRERARPQGQEKNEPEDR